MRLESLQIDGFGMMTGGRKFEFAPGLNMVYGTNEAGKSTLLDFIVAMLYGMKVEGVQRRSWLPEYERFKPWAGGKYAGNLIFSTDEGRRIAVYRDLTEDKVSLFDEDTGKALTDTYSIDKRKELIFAKEILGLSRSLFVNSACIRQLSSGFSGDDGKSLASYASSVVEKGERDITTARAIELLNNEIESIGKTERGKDFKRLKDRANELKGSLVDNNQRQEELYALRLAFGEREMELLAVRADLQEYRSVLLHDSISEAEAKLDRIRILKDRSQKSQKIIGENAGMKGFDPGKKDEVIRLSERLKRLKSDKASKKKELDKMMPGLEELRKDIAALKQFSKVSQEELEEFDIIARKWEDLRNDMKSKNRQLGSQKYTDEKTTMKVNKLSVLFARLPKHVDQIFLKLETDYTRLDAEVANRDGRFSLIKKKARKLLFGLVSTLLLPVMAVVSIFHFHLKPTGIWLIPFVASGVVFIALFLLFAGKLRNVRKESRTFKEGGEDLLAKRDDIKSRIASILDTAGCETGDELIVKYNTYLQVFSGREQIRQEHLQEDINRLSSQIKDQENEMLILLERAYPGIRPDKIDSKLTVKYIHEGERYLELIGKEFEIATAVGKLKREIDEITAQAGDLEKSVGKIFHDSGVKSEKEYLKKYDEFTSWDKSLKEMERDRVEMENLLSGRSVEEIEKELQDWNQEAQDIGDAGADAQIDDDHADKAKALREKEKELENELGRLSGNMEKIQENLEDRDILESKLEQTRADLQSLRNYKDSLQVAMHTLDHVSETIYRKLAPLLSQGAEALLTKITDEKYNNLKIDEELNITLITRESAVPVSVASLSYGTIDQVYLAVRLALSQLFSENGETLPVLLDDSLTQYDDPRAKNALEALSRVSEMYQVIMFSCHERDRDNFSAVLRDSESANLIEL